MQGSSRLVGEDKVYIKYDPLNFKTSLDKSNNFEAGSSYRRVHYTHDDQNIKKNTFVAKEGFFFDKNFIIEEQDLASLGDPTKNQKIVLRRLYDLYKMLPKNSYTSFFPASDYISQKKLSADPTYPHFSTQIGLFQPEFFKSFFITQDYDRQGFYQMIINVDGRFETGCVDDWVPVYEHSLQPIWGMDFDQGWQIILLKFWAKRNGGYRNVRNLPPFSFIESFTNSNWKYFNIPRQGPNFLATYSGKVHLGKFILKTKDTNLVHQAGLIPNSAGYQLVDLEQIPNSSPHHLKTSSVVHTKKFNEIETNNNFYNQVIGKNDKNHTSGLKRLQSIQNVERKWVATIRSTLINKWSGSFSVLDKTINGRYTPKKPLALERDFMISEADFLNLFSNAYVASKRQEQKEYISDYYLIDVEPRNKNSIYIKFDIHKPGWLDFCIKQSQQNKVSIGQSGIQNKNISESIMKEAKRYLKLRFILVKVNSSSSPSSETDPKFNPPKYDAYEIQYFHGYNRGDAKFLNVIPGTYILKIKPEQVDHTARFVINYASNSVINMQQINPSKKQTSLILRQAMASLIGSMALQYPEVDRKFEQIVFSNTFQNIGYGFVGVRSSKTCPYSILIEVDPKLLKDSGYKIKNQFKKHSDPFSVVVRPGESSTIVLKKIPRAQYAWPPNGIEVLKQVKSIADTSSTSNPNQVPSQINQQQIQGQPILTQ